MKMDKNTIRSAIHEIRQLRRTNEILGAQVHVIEVFSAALLGRPSQGAGLDIAWQLERELETDEKE